MLFSHTLQCSLSDKVKEVDKVEEAASMLTGIADEIPFTPPEIEADSDRGEFQRGEAEQKV